MKIIEFYCIIVLFLSAPDLFAEPPQVRIEDLVTEALERNPELNFYRAEISAAKGDRRQSAALANPELSAEFGRKRARDAGLSAEGTAWSVSVMQTFEFPGRLALRKAIANRQVELAELGLEHFRASLAARVRALAFELYTVQQRGAVAAEIEHRGRDLMNVLVQRDPAGITPLLETRIIEANIVILRAESLRAVTEANAALMELNQLRGAPLKSEFNLAKLDLRLPDLPPLEELLSIAATNNFQLRMRQVELAQQGFRVELARNERWPSIALGPFYSQERAGEKEQIVGLGISIPLPLWNRNAGTVESSEARLTQAETSLRLAQRELERELRQQHLSFQTFSAQLSQWRTNILQELREAADLGDRHYRLGALPVSTYVELQEKFAEGMKAVLETQSAALRSLNTVELLAGIPIGSATALQSPPRLQENGGKSP